MVDGLIIKGPPEKHLGFLIRGLRIKIVLSFCYEIASYGKRKV